MLGPQQMLFVRCYGPATARAKDMRNLLEKTQHRLAFQGFTLTVREETDPGADLSLLWGPRSWDDIGPKPEHVYGLEDCIKAVRNSTNCQKP
jgi:hypothetical protein